MEEAPTKIYIPHPSDPERLAVLAQSSAPVRIYIPQSRS